MERIKNLYMNIGNGAVDKPAKASLKLLLFKKELHFK